MIPLKINICYSASGEHYYRFYVKLGTCELEPPLAEPVFATDNRKARITVEKIYGGFSIHKARTAIHDYKQEQQYTNIMNSCHIYGHHNV